VPQVLKLLAFTKASLKRHVPQLNKASILSEAKDQVAHLRSNFFAYAVSNRMFRFAQHGHCSQFQPRNVCASARNWAPAFAGGTQHRFSRNTCGAVSLLFRKILAKTVHSAPQVLPKKRLKLNPL
jgi:hypothetical protein